MQRPQKDQVRPERVVDRPEQAGDADNVPLHLGDPHATPTTLRRPNTASCARRGTGHCIPRQVSRQAGCSGACCQRGPDRAAAPPPAIPAARGAGRPCANATPSRSRECSGFPSWLCRSLPAPCVSLFHPPQLIKALFHIPKGRFIDGIIGTQLPEERHSVLKVGPRQHQRMVWHIVWQRYPVAPRLFNFRELLDSRRVIRVPPATWPR